MMRVILEGVVKRFGPVVAVDDASFELRPREVTYLLGPKGAGKTTLARCIAGLDRIDDGEIYFGDRMVQDLAPHEREVGFVFDDLGLWPELTVVENVGFPLRARGHSRVERKRKVEESLTTLRIDSLAGRRPGKLTAAQRLRVAVARALIQEPGVLILDEPMRHVEPRAWEDFAEDLKRLHAELNLTTMITSEDPAEALASADRLAVMDLGRIVQCDLPEQLYNRPADVFVARLLGATNLLQGQVESQAIDIRGDVVVRTPLGRLIARSGAGAPPQGSPVTVSLRPETLALGATTPPGWNRFPATIERITFKGELRQVRARGPGDWPIVVSVLQSQSQALREGQSLTVSVAPEHVVVLPGKFAVGKTG
jgi:ABC-type Fe3+/spermidine/putrescine transport system ATPase subunit